MHTPAPWNITHCAGGYLIEHDHNMNNRIVRGSGGIRDRDNAQLIATAPELLEACNLALETLYANGLLRGTAQTLEAVIAKATGDQCP